MKRNLFIIFSISFLFFAAPCFVFAATNVYYSVGQNINNHCGPAGDGNNCGNVSISSGLATFTAAQAGSNLGVGDVLTVGGNTYYLASKISTTQWNVVTNVGVAPVDLGSTAVTSITHAFSSLATALPSGPGAGAKALLGQDNLTTGGVGGYVVNIPCYYDTGADTAAVLIDGWTTDADNYVKVYTPSNTATEANQSQRHSGVWDDTKYNLAVSSDARALDLNDLYIQVVGLQVSISSYDRHAILILRDGILVDRTIAKVINTAQTAVQASALTMAEIRNSVIYGATRFGLVNNSGTLNVRNVTTARNGRDGLWIAGGTVNATNVASVYNGDGVTYFDFRLAGGVALNCTNCASVDGTADDFGGTGNRANITPSFVDEPGRNYHLSSTDDDLRNLGSDLSGSFTDDIDSQSRSGLNWDIGADEANFNGPFTVSVWVKPDATPVSDTIVAKAEELRVVTDASGKPACQIKSQQTWRDAATSGTALTVGQWSHVTCSYDQTSLKIYVNGVERGSQALTVGVDNMTSDWKIGQDDSSGTTYGSWNGMIDDFQFYNYARTVEEVQTDFSNGASVSPHNATFAKPLVDYKFDEGVSDAVHNAGEICGDAAQCVSTEGILRSGSGGANTSSTQMWSLDGYMGKAVELDGTDDRVELPDVGY